MGIVEIRCTVPKRYQIKIAFLWWNGGGAYMDMVSRIRAMSSSLMPRERRT